MKTGRLWLLLATAAPLTAQELAAPLRKYDRDRDGKLTGEELVLARQAHNRGGRDAEPRPGKWKEMLQRFEKDFAARRQKDFDLNKDGRLDETERRAMGEVWQKAVAKITEARARITAKYDRNDDGELNEQERGASRGESERTRRDIEEECVREWRSRNAPPAA